MLRSRDVLAVLLALMLTRMAWNDQAENLSASIHLSFYFPVGIHQIGPAPLDVDGDGTTEALVTVRPTPGSTKDNVPTPQMPKSWTIHVLDLKPLHSGEAVYGKTAFPREPGAPFQPLELVKWSEPITFDDSSSPSSNDGLPDFVRPLQIITGQVMVEGIPDMKSANVDHLDADYQNTRTRHYFCGTDWHDAAQKCGTPCPSGTSDECPDEEKCYADTPCDSSKADNKASSMSMGDNEWSTGSHYVTPAGGLPSVFTVWSNGEVSMHSLTAAKPETDGDQKDKGRFGRKKPGLELKSMWKTQALPKLPVPIKNPGKIQLTFLDSYDSMSDAPHGMVIISGELPPQPEDVAAIRQNKQVRTARFIVALDAMSGQVVWDSLHNFNIKQEDVPLPLHVERGTSSIARRRSMVAQLDATLSTTNKSGGDDQPTSESSLPNCMAAYRSSLLGTTDALPYEYWGFADAGVRAVHLDHTQSHRKLQKHHPNQPDFHKHHASSTSSSHAHKPGTHSSSSSHHHHQSKKGVKQQATTRDSWHSSLINPRKLKKNLGRQGGHVHYGRPNVLVNHHQGGLHVHSLQNGQPLCQLSLLEETLYVDLQRDGVIDSVQVVTQSKNLLKDMETGEFQDPWVAELAKRVSGESGKDEEDEALSKDTKRARRMKNAKLTSKLCHALALSGMPAKEELFSTSLCATGAEARNSKEGMNSLQLFAAPPLVVESLYAQHRNREKDVIFAMSNGMVSRIRGGTGRRQWKLNGRKIEGFPSWGRWEAQQTVSMTRLEVLQPQSGGGGISIKPHARPILLVGESSLAVLSATSANVLAVSTVPQRTFQRPILADLSGDGTTDVMVVTSDAVWGYVIVVRSGASIFFRIMVGCLMMGILLAVLRNRFGHQQMRNQHKRSTDA